MRGLVPRAAPARLLLACLLLQGNRKNAALPAGSWAHSFLFGTEVPDAHSIKLLNEDFLAHL